MLRQALSAGTPALEEITIPEQPFVFLGGTTNDTNWREELIGLLDVAYFNPIVENWTEECVRQEELAKERAKALLYVITPMQYGHYSLVELAVSACKAIDKRVIITFLKRDEGEAFDEAQLKSIDAIKDLLSKATNAEFFSNLRDTAACLNLHLANISAQTVLDSAAIGQAS